MFQRLTILPLLLALGCTGLTQRPHEVNEDNAKRWAKDSKLDASHISCGGPERNGYQLCTFYVGSTVQIFECTRHDVDQPADGCREPNLQ